MLHAIRTHMQLLFAALQALFQSGALGKPRSKVQGSWLSGLMWSFAWLRMYDKRLCQEVNSQEGGARGIVSSRLPSSWLFLPSSAGLCLSRGQHPVRASEGHHVPGAAQLLMVPAVLCCVVCLFACNAVKCRQVGLPVYVGEVWGVLPLHCPCF